MAKTLDSFRAKHDPAYVIQTPQTVLRRGLPPAARRFIITSAQNGTPVHNDFWACLLAAAKHLRAEILVIPLRYKNPTSQFTGSQQNAEWWAPAVTPYLWNQRHALNENLTLLADIKTQPTAVDPLAGMDAVSLASSGILGHTKVALRNVPTPQGKMAKTLTTCGACTVPNYTDTRTGKIGEFHHSLSAVLVELEDDGKRFHMRQLHYGAGARRVIDLNDAYHVGGYQKAPRALAVVCGDTHVDFLCPMVDDTRHRKGGLIETVNPENIIEHDTLDAYSCSPHHRDNPMIAIAKRLSGRDSIRDEVNRALAYLRRVSKRHPKTQIRIAGSNHNDMLGRAVRLFLQDGLRTTSPVNAEFLLETALAQVRGCKLGDTGTQYPDAFGLHVEAANIPRVHVLGVDESFMLAEVECGGHGHVGPNGSRGSLRNLARIGVKVFDAHDHTGGIFEGHYRVGTGTRRTAEYTSGPSSWMNIDGVLNADGKRQLIPLIEGRFRR